MQFNSDFLKKVMPILESAGITQSSQLFNEKGQIDLEKVIAISSKVSEKMAEQNSEEEQSQIIEETKTEDFPSLLPIAMKVSSRLISNDLIFASKEEIDEVKKKVQSENRDGKIEAVIEGVEFAEKKLEYDEEYKELIKKGVTPMSAPSGNLFYLDYKYSNKPNTHKKTRRAGKKHKNKNA